ncbi:GntR family transcriptional regulator [Undibacterium sp. SXout20W]|uniref:GntR family transcriptional regulator n=1 Tax=Undibacterium sp. SXout20W TaxID=3413051 RepID=UPI003BF3B734
MLTNFEITDPVEKKRAADVAYDALESMIVTMELKPGAPIIEAYLIDKTGLGRTPLREALMRMASNGLILPMPRRGLVVSDIEVSAHLSLIETRRVLERLIAQNAAERATPQQRKELVVCAEQMLIAAKRHTLNDYMAADQAFDHIIQNACANPSAVAAVIPLIIKSRRFWYAHQHEGDLEECARCHLLVAKAVAKGKTEMATKAIDGLMDYLESFARLVPV